MKDYYSILHVLPSAEIDVIKAAYRALSRKYHPDTYAGDKAYAGKRMQEINDAFGVIGDPDKRKKYDAERKAANTQDDYSESGEDVDARTEEDWVIACKFCPEAVFNFEQLHKLSRSLAFAFKSYLLESKQFPDSRMIRDKFRAEFLKNYFGANPTVQEIGEDLILAGKMAAAKSVNRAVKVMGASLDIGKLYEMLKGDFNISSSKTHGTPQDLTKMQQLFLKAKKPGNYMDFEELLNELNIPFSSGWCKYKITHQGKLLTVSYKDVPSWIADNLSRLPDFRGL